jgi:hypothetical protein
MEKVNGASMGLEVITYCLLGVRLLLDHAYLTTKRLSHSSSPVFIFEQARYYYASLFLLLLYLTCQSHTYNASRLNLEC